MKIVDYTTISSLIFAFENTESLDLAIIECIKLNEFSKHKKPVTLYSLQYNIHKNAVHWIIAYQYTTSEEETLYDPPIFDIAIKVPKYTSVFVEELNEERLIKPPPGNIRKVIVKPKNKKRKNSETTAPRSVYTAYCEV